MFLEDVNTKNHRAGLAKASRGSLLNGCFHMKESFQVDDVYESWDLASWHLSTFTTSCILLYSLLAQWWHQRGHFVKKLSLALFDTVSIFIILHKCKSCINSRGLIASRFRLFPQWVLMEPTAQSRGVAPDKSKHSLLKRRKLRNALPQQQESGVKGQKMHFKQHQ